MLSASHMGSASMSLIGRLVWVFTAVAAMAASTVAVAQPTLIKEFRASHDWSGQCLAGAF